MKNPVHIRQFRFPDDFNPVIDLWDHSGPGVHRGRSDTAAEIAKKQNKDPDLFLVAEYFGKIIGAVMGGYDGRRGLVYHLAVEENYRQQGIGNDLLEELEELLRKKGCLRSYLLITKDNPAIKFYEKHGWQLLDLYAMGKDLQ
jgi:ribosomal protein S18 acetylase RimI-like enzyme